MKGAFKFWGMYRNHRLLVWNTSEYGTVLMKEELMILSGAHHPVFVE